MFNFISPRLRITLGLSTIVVSVLLFGSMLGVVPDHERTVMESRGDLCETIAVAGCQFIANGDADQLDTLIGFVVQRNDDVISGRVRNAAGDTLALVGPHHWDESTLQCIARRAGPCTTTHVERAVGSRRNNVSPSVTQRLAGLDRKQPYSAVPVRWIGFGGRLLLLSVTNSAAAGSFASRTASRSRGFGYDRGRFAVAGCE